MVKAATFFRAADIAAIINGQCMMIND